MSRPRRPTSQVHWLSPTRLHRRNQLQKRLRLHRWSPLTRRSLRLPAQVRSRRPHRSRGIPSLTRPGKSQPAPWRLVRLFRRTPDSRQPMSRKWWKRRQWKARSWNHPRSHPLPVKKTSSLRSRQRRPFRFPRMRVSRSHRKSFPPRRSRFHPRLPSHLHDKRPLLTGTPAKWRFRFTGPPRRKNGGKKSRTMLHRRRNRHRRMNRSRSPNQKRNDNGNPPLTSLLPP